MSRTQREVASPTSARSIQAARYTKAASGETRVQMSSAIPLAAKLPKLCTAASRLKRCRPAPGSQRRISHG
jgi:hypothetical protein